MSLRTYSRLVAIVGRPNVGKSTLFNRMIRERKSLVFDEPGVTRDRIFARAEYTGIAFFLCDTGGFEPTAKDNIKKQLVEQAELAIEEADAVIFVGDGREGLHPVDADLVRRLRKSDKRFFLAVNKCDLPKDDILAEEFRRLGVEKVYPVSAEHARGVGDLLEDITNFLAGKPELPDQDPDEIKLAIIGRPNVGKSSILNRVTGEARSLVDPRPGTTRDTVDALITYHGRKVRVLDTAGIRRKSRMVDNMERYSALRSVTCLEDADVAMLVVDAVEGITEGDARVAGYAFEMRKPLLIVVNKWDLYPEKDSKSAAKFTLELRQDLRYLSYIPVVFVSALENLRVSKLLPLAVELYDEASNRTTTSKVNNALREILVKHTPPLANNRSRPIKFYYATQVGVRPPRFIVFAANANEIHFSYKRFVENEFRDAFNFQRVPISVVFRNRESTKREPGSGPRPNKRHDNAPDFYGQDDE